MDQSDSAVDLGMIPQSQAKRSCLWYEVEEPTCFKHYTHYCHNNDWKPDNTLFTSYSSRLKSFEKWPKQMKPTGQELAHAGFYYLGSGDSVRCFHCRVQLYNWETKDHAIIEHKRLSPLCKFVEMVHL